MKKKHTSDPSFREPSLRQQVKALREHMIREDTRAIVMQKKLEAWEGIAQALAQFAKAHIQAL